MQHMPEADCGTPEALSALSRLFESNLQCEVDLDPCSTQQPPRMTCRGPQAGTRVQSCSQSTQRESKRRAYNYADKSIWTDDELAQSSPAHAAEEMASSPDACSPDTRARPEFTIHYGFDVTSEDVYLGLGGKCNSMQHADHLKVLIDLPLVKSKEEVQVDVTSQGLVELTSSIYRLSLPLPNPVDENKGMATWDPDLHRLTLKLPLVKMFAF